MTAKRSSQVCENKRK